MLAAIALPPMNPVAIQLGPFQVYWYALAYVAGLLFASWYIKRLVTFPKLWGAMRPSVLPAEVDDLFIWFMIGVIGGGRLGYVLFYKPQFYFSNPLEIFKTWDGGMSFHGGFLGVVMACWLWGRRNDVTLDRLLDLGAAVTPVGLGLGRIANFINAELLGRPADMPWAVVYAGDTVARHPSQLYEAVLEGLLLFIAVRIGTHHYAILQKPGRASGIFALGYGLSRIFVEYFRTPDAHVGYIGGFWTLGMIYSLPLVAIGLWLLWRSRRLA
jgi:phosphatidylglycerol---prolipoprotein diacylglyceryl transferase